MTGPEQPCSGPSLLPARLFLKMWLPCILTPPSFFNFPHPKQKKNQKPQHCHKVSVGVGVWKGSNFCAGTGFAACESGSVAWLSSVARGGERDVQRHGALLLDPGTGMSRALLRPGGLTDLPSLPEPD